MNAELANGRLIRVHLQIVLEGCCPFLHFGASTESQHICIQ